MKKLTIALIAGFLAVFAVVTLTALARSLAKPATILKRDKPLLKRLAELKEAYPDGQPRAETVETEFCFGTLNPGETSEHSFVIRNTGLAPLALKEGPTTCKCTLSDLRNNLLLPGKETDVRLDWNTGRTESEFRQSATIFTNDPERREIVFRVHGKVSLAYYAEPRTIQFPDIIPGQRESAATFVCSQRWDSFTISQIESNIDGLIWTIEPLAPEALRSVDARRAIGWLLPLPPSSATPG
jgi:hypothetical protein